jgi:cell wall assembly regulator SMI1
VAAPHGPAGLSTPLERILASAPSIRLAAPGSAGAVEAAETETGLTLPRAVRDLLGPLGTAGQIISYGADDDEHYCYATDLDAFLIRVAELLESGDAVIGDRGWRFPASRNSRSPIDLFV